MKGGGEGYFDFSGFFYFFRGKNLIEEKIEKLETSFNRKFLNTNFLQKYILQNECLIDILKKFVKIIILV